jgi:L-seryl-tRNA(Ser) seleniumtransferase
VAVSGANAEQLDAHLRAGEPPVIGRIADDRLLLDVRTLEDDDLLQVATALRETIA